MAKAMETLGVEQLVSISFFLFNLVDAKGVLLTGNGDSLVSDGVSKQHTAPRASITCHTRNFARRVHVAQDDRGILLIAVCVFLEKSFHLTRVSPHLA